jgi:hypothetical protein
MSGSLDSLVERLRKALGGDLISVVLYGSAAAGDHDPKFSDYNVLCVLNSITPVQLGATESVFRWWRQEGNPAPLLLTEHEVQKSTDCFPIEFEDIKANHRILYGRDVVSSIAVDRCFYRAQVEHDLRAKLVRLRQKASGILSDQSMLVRLMVDSISTFCVLFRHALVLHGAETGDAPSRKREVIAKAQERFGIDPAPFNTLLDHREQKEKSKENDPAALLAAYMNEIGKVIDAVDVLEKGISG